MFDLKTLAVIKQIKVGPGLDGIMYDEPDDKIILTNHSRPIGTLTAIDPEDRRHRRHGRARRHRARGRRGRRQGTHLREQRRQEHDPGDRRQDVEGDRVVAARAVRRADRHRVRQGVEPHLLRLQQDVRRPRREHGQGRGVHHERHARRRPGMGSVEEADLHSERGRGQRHGRPPGFGRTSTRWWRRSPTFAGAKTITVDPATHNVYLFQPERGPAPPPPADAPPPAAGRADAAAVRRVRSSPRGSSSSSSNDSELLYSSGFGRLTALLPGTGDRAFQLPGLRPRGLSFSSADRRIRRGRAPAH